MRIHLTVAVMALLLAGALHPTGLFDRAAAMQPAADVPEIWTVGVDGTGAIATGLLGGLPVWSPDGTRLAVLTEGDDGAHALIVANADGSGQRTLPAEHLLHLAPGWSPDGRFLLVVADDETVEAIAIDGSGVRRLVKPGDVAARFVNFVDGVRHPDWSPDGRQVAFVGRPDAGGTEIEAVTVDGANQTRLTNLPEDWDAADPEWSPDGTKIAFSVYGPTREISGTYVMRADGSELAKIADYEVMSEPWSPDSRTLLLENYLGEGASEFHVVAADGSWDVDLTGQLDFGGSACWSFDGSSIVLSTSFWEHSAAADPDNPSYDLWLVSVDGTAQTRLTETPLLDEGNPARSPDGTRIAYIAVPPPKDDEEGDVIEGEPENDTTIGD